MYKGDQMWMICVTTQHENTIWEERRITKFV